MWFLYLDESGDLGFDFVNKKPSKFFTITILAISDVGRNREMINCVKRTLKRKLAISNQAAEIKGSKISLEIKRYFYSKCAGVKFGLYSMTLNKKRLYDSLARDKNRVYNYVARLVLDKIPFEKAVDRVMMVVDKSKGKPEIAEFNSYIIRALEGRISPGVPLNISHELSHENLCLQAADVFCWGIFRKYEKKDTIWYDVFSEKVRFDDVYLP